MCWFDIELSTGLCSFKESTKKFDLSWLISMSKGQLKVNEEDSLVFFIVELQFNFYIYWRKCQIVNNQLFLSFPWILSVHE